MLVGMLEVLKASTRQPEGMSNVRMMESREAVMSQRESGEKATSRIRPRKPVISRTTRRVSMSMRRTERSSQTTASRPLSRWRVREVMVELMARTFRGRAVWKSKNWWKGVGQETISLCAERYEYR
jgi:hypothetical protein